MHWCLTRFLSRSQIKSIESLLSRMEPAVKHSGVCQRRRLLLLLRRHWQRAIAPCGCTWAKSWNTLKTIYKGYKSFVCEALVHFVTVHFVTFRHMFISSQNCSFRHSRFISSHLVTKVHFVTGSFRHKSDLFYLSFIFDFK
jgi:hypothetical protein